MSRAAYYVWESFYGDDGLTKHDKLEDHFPSANDAWAFVLDNINSLRNPYVKCRNQKIPCPDNLMKNFLKTK